MAAEGELHTDVSLDGQGADPFLGRRVGQYSVLRRIGQGGMGIVYEAKHERMGQRAALKVLQQDQTKKDPKVLQRFFNEARAISTAQHAGIVKIFDCGQLEDGTAYILMEFLDGETLSSRLERHGQSKELLAVEQVIEITYQIAAALVLIHGKGIVHRDLKPENVFLVPDPVAPFGERMKLLDFGVAKFKDITSYKTTVGIILGTPLYMSPEQCEGREDVTDKVDVYALGIMLFEMLAGRMPFIAESGFALMRQHIFRAPENLAMLAPQLPPPLVALVHSMLIKKPEERPSMEQVLAALQQLGATGTRATARLSGGATIATTTRTVAEKADIGFAQTTLAPRAISRRLAVVAAAVVVLCIGLGAWLLRPKPGAQISSVPTAFTPPVSSPSPAPPLPPSPDTPERLAAPLPQSGKPRSAGVPPANRAALGKRTKSASSDHVIRLD